MLYIALHKRWWWPIESMHTILYINMPMLPRKLSDLLAIHRSQCVHWNWWVIFWNEIDSECAIVVNHLSESFEVNFKQKTNNCVTTHSDLRRFILRGWIKGLSQTDVKHTSSVHHQFHWRFCAVFGQSICYCNHRSNWNGIITTKNWHSSFVGAIDTRWHLCISHFVLFHHGLRGKHLTFNIIKYIFRYLLQKFSFSDDYWHDISVFLWRLRNERWLESAVLHAT